MAVPSIKGTAFQSVLEDIERLVAEGRLSRDELEAQIEARDLAILDEKLSPVTWYPIASYERCVELLVRCEAPGRREPYLVERGERAAERLAGLGIYSQLDATTRHMGTRVGHVIVSLSQAIYNFTRWRYEPRPDGGWGFTIRVENAAAFPEVSRFATQGFVQHVATHATGRPMRVVSDRPSPDLVLYVAEPTG